MNRDKQMAKDAENKKAQAREEYAKNKPLLSGYRVKEKSIDYVHPSESDPMNDELQEDIARNKISE